MFYFNCPTRLALSGDFGEVVHIASIQRQLGSQSREQHRCARSYPWTCAGDQRDFAL